jgi:MFS family permease
VLTVIFAVYAVGVLAGLFLIANSSDSLGRRPVILLGIGMGALSAIVFLAATGVPELLLARVLSGFSVGLVTGTATAALTELEPTGNRARASGVAATLNLLGLASGPLLAGVLAQYAPSPTELIFWVDLVLLVPAAAGILMAPETAPLRRQGVKFRRPGVYLPREVRPVFARAAVAAFAGFSVVGLYSALAGDLLIRTLGITNLAVVGAAVFLLFASGALGQLLWARARWPRPMSYGLTALLVGVLLNLAALLGRSPEPFWAGILISGLGFGLSLLGSLRLLNDYVPPERRGEILGEYFLVAYVAISVPVVGVGEITGALGLRFAAEVFTTLVVVVLAMGLLMLRARPDVPPLPPSAPPTGRA